MSYDLCARADASYSRSLTRAAVAAVVAGTARVAANGPCGFAMQERDSMWMEIDLESVSPDGDAVETANGETSPTVNCINFHVPQAFTARLEECRGAALQIARALGWELFDPQLDAVVAERSVRPRRTWWRFWQ